MAQKKASTMAPISSHRTCIPFLMLLLHIRVYALARRDNATLDATPAMAPGSACASEGHWNCLGDGWQRCAAGRWSATEQVALGTACVPTGLTRDMHIVASDSGTANTNTDAQSPASTCPAPPAAPATTSADEGAKPPGSAGGVNGAGGGVVGGSGAGLSGRQGGRPPLVVAAGVGTMAVVFARLLV